MNPFLERQPTLLVFDLDGTLIDSVEDIRAALNEFRAQRGAEPRALELVKAAIGRGAHYFFEAINGDLLASESESFDVLFAEYFALYRQRSLDSSPFYPRLIECLELARRDHQLAILTNKPQAITDAIIEAKGLGKYFERVLSPENARGRKPDPAGLVGLLEDLDTVAERSIMVGDSVSDFGAGAAAGVFTIGLRHGYYQPGEPDPDLWLANLVEFERLLVEAGR